MNLNTEIELAWQCVENTGTHLFLTGKAGTGKTTFLRKLKEQSPKRMVVVAPTGIAAINAGGVTIHSFFQLSFAPYVPESKFTSAQSPYKFGREKISIIRSMDLLVIDEVSMVRSDLLDAVDAVLRRYRDRHKPFGGVQLLMIGDLQQLAPVVKEDEWSLLSKYYDTPFFFGSQALRQTEYITIQLEKVYRQSDETFLALLNRIRVNDIDDSVLTALNRRYIPNFQPGEEEGYIRLTTHNYQAQRINERQLSQLSGIACHFRADIKGNFPETAYPADVDLVLKKGAQIMFIKNDSSGNKRFYNGKIGLITAVSKDSIRVWGRGDATDFLLETEEWTNSKYTINADTKEIKEEIEGTFRQYPIRLAWAITIHKSQGLTFEHAIIDAASSFAHGQVYVALSRCKSLEGMVLGSLLYRDSVICDESINEFTRGIEHTIPNESQLDALQRRYYYDLLCEQFGFGNIKKHFSVILRILDEHLYRLYPKVLERYKENYGRFQTEIENISISFLQQYANKVLIVPDYKHHPVLSERVISAARYFHDKTEEIVLDLMRETRISTDNKDIKEKFGEAFSALKEFVLIKVGTLKHTAENGFTVPSYLKSKAHIIVSLASVDTKTASRKDKKSGKTESPKPVKVEVPSDVMHPVLYERLILWRNREAARTGAPVYTVIQQKAILGIVNLLPGSKEELERIPYFGKKSVEKYGAELLELIDKYVRKYNVKRPRIFS